MGKKIIYFTRFMPSVNFGGGCRRMMQIWEALKRFYEDSEVVSAQRKNLISQDALSRIRQNSRGDSRYQQWSEKRRQYVYYLEEISREWSRITEKFASSKLAIIDDPIYFIPLFEEIKKLNIPIISVCHNLETLSPEQVDTNSVSSFLKREIDLLAQSDLVITISREETFLLHNLRIKTFFLPYYPVDSILKRLQNVRCKRKNTEKNGILLLGNALNLQTMQGMEAVISFWQSSGLFRKQGKLIVAGYGTDQNLKNDYDGNAIEFLGTLPNDEFDRLLTRVKACLCFQESGSGALTRICEMLIAAVPVLANSHATRSYYNMDGVIEFYDLKDIGETCRKISFLYDNIPIPEPPGSKDFHRKIASLL